MYCNNCQTLPSQMESTVNNERPAVRRIIHLTAAMNGWKPMDVKDELLFDPSVLKMVDWTDKKSTYKGSRSPSNPGNNLLIRPLALHDFDRGYLPLLGQLTATGNVTRESFGERFRQMKSCPGTYYIAVVEDTARQRQVIGTTTLVVEQKFIHSTGMRGRIEDVVVSEDYRGLELGKLLVETMTLLGKAVGCYKVSLECADKNVRFYEGLGFNVDEKYMVRRFGH